MRLLVFTPSLIFCVCLFIEGSLPQATDCERERGRHCHKWAQCERRQGDQRPRCYCSPGFGGDGYNCNRDQQSSGTDCEREQGRHCHKWAQCERRQGDQKPRCYCSPGYGGDGYNCHRGAQNQGGQPSSRCPQPANIAHGSFTSSDGSYKSGTIVTYRCQDGYSLQGNGQRTCQQNGQWSGSETRCEQQECKGRCQKPQNLDGGIMTMGGGCEVGSRVSYRCNSGMMLIGSTERTCQGDGHWSGTHPRCEKSTDCEREHGKHCHRWAQCERRQGDPKPRCYCSSGYHGDGYNCHEREKDECQKINHQTCHVHADCIRVEEGRYQCKCRDGYKGDGVYCEGKGCGRPPGITNGRVLSDQQRFVSGNVITYQCDRGNRMLGDALRTCRDDGGWSGSEPRCEPKQHQPAKPKVCKRPQDIQHGTKTASDWNFPPGSTVSYQCRKPYNINGNSQRTCQHNGQWSGSKPECKKRRRQAKRCQRPQDIPNGNLRTSDGAYKPRAVVTYECQHPYRLLGNSQRTCLANGKWTGSTPTCDDVEAVDQTQCQRPPDHIPHGRLTVSDYQFRPGTIITYVCERGWKIQGSAQRTCQHDGRWSGTRPKCQRGRKDKCQNRCHANAECRTDQGRGRCVCHQQYFGDGYNCQGCEGGQVYRDCATRCPPTCENPRPVCNEGCDQNNKCICPEGKVQRSAHDKTCVDPKQCRN